MDPGPLIDLNEILNLKSGLQKLKYLNTWGNIM